MIALSPLEARRYILAAAFPDITEGTSLERSATLLEHLGYVQIDAISVIERAHHHIFWSRNPDYVPEDLNALLHQKQAFEYWGHAASYLPLSDYRHYVHAMENFLTRSTWGRRRLESHGHLMPDILARIASEGPLTASDFKGERRGKSGWWNWKPAKVALELLYWQGKIMVCERRGVQKVYDLAERFLPKSLNTQTPTLEDTAAFCVERALKAHGIMQFKAMTQYLPLVPKTLLKQALDHAIEAQTVMPVKIGDVEAYALRSHLEKPAPVATQTRILSPFDLLIIQRARLPRYFDFTYLFEAYVPRERRQHGYFVLPVLQGEHFVGRLDLKAHRQTKTLEVLRWLPETDNSLSASAFSPPQLQEALEAFAAFNGCHHVTGDWP